MTREKQFLVACVATYGCLLVAPAMAVQVQITIENLAPADSVATSPFFVGAHDGSFDAFDVSALASAGVEDVAELGDGTQIMSELTAAQATAVSGTVLATNGGFGGMIFTPGSTGSIILDLDPSMHRYLSYGAMVVPSNDAFFGNASPTEVELFDAGGNFVASDFTLFGSDVWDAGTEINQLTGAAYVVGQSAPAGDTEGGTVAAANLSDVFSVFLGEETPPGAIFNTVPGSGTAISSFSFAVVPEPGTITLLVASVILLGAVGRGQRSVM